MVAVPAAAALTVHWAKPPTALLALQKPLPEKPAWFESMVPLQVAFSASYLVGAAWAMLGANPSMTRLPTRIPRRPIAFLSSNQGLSDDVRVAVAVVALFGLRE